MDCILRGTNSPDNKRNKHTGSRSQEERSSTELIDRESEADSDTPIPDRERTVDLELDVRVGDTNSVHDLSEVVRNKTVTRPLGEKTSSHDQQKSMAITLRRDQFSPSGGTGGSGFELNRLLNLLILELHKRVGGITVGVVSGENLQGLFGLIFR